MAASSRRAAASCSAVTYRVPKGGPGTGRSTAVRCANEHYVPNGFAYCRRCEDMTSTHAVTFAPMPTTLLTVGQYVEQRDRMVGVDAAVLALCAVVVMVGSPLALLPGALVGVAALLATRLVAGLWRKPAQQEAPASASHIRTLERLVMTPVVAVVATAVCVVLAS